MGVLSPLERELEDFRAQAVDVAPERQMDNLQALSWMLGVLAACSAIEAGQSVAAVRGDVYAMNERNKAGAL